MDLSGAARSLYRFFEEWAKLDYAICSIQLVDLVELTPLWVSCIFTAGLNLNTSWDNT